MIRVVGAVALGTMHIDLPVVARTRRVLDGLRDGAEIRLEHSYDECFGSSPSGALEHIRSDVTRRGMESDIVYLTPGAGAPGDATVALLDQALISAVTSAVPERPGMYAGRFLTVDALELALAEEQAPFDRGLAAIDPAMPLVVTNWYGDGVTELAGRRLKRLYDLDELTSPTAAFELLVPARERLTPMASIAELEHIIARLRRPDGCPWDREQTRESLLPQFAGELDELIEAVEAGDTAHQAEELGDVLFHVIAQCQVAAEAGDFTFDDVLRGITAKLVRRHPHVFGDVVATSYDDVLATWQRVKDEERVAASAQPALLDTDEGDQGV